MRQFFRPAVEALTPYVPGKPVEDVQRELGLERVVKLASNEGPFPPFPAALEAMARSAGELNRYPDGGVHRLHEALAERHGVALDQVCAGAGADGCIDMLSQAVLDPGDESRVLLAVVPELRDLRAQAGRDAGDGAAARPPLRPRRDARRGHAAHEDRLRLPSEQSDRDDEHEARARRVLRAACPPTSSSSSTRRTSSTSTGPTTRMRSRRT